MNTGRIKISEAAMLLGVSEQFIRAGLQQGILPFGTAVKLSSKWTYYIYPQKLVEYSGLDLEKELTRIREANT